MAGVDTKSSAMSSLWSSHCSLYTLNFSMGAFGSGAALPPPPATPALFVNPYMC